VTRNISNKWLAFYKVLYNVYGPQRWWPARTPLEVIVGAILTQNTAWSNVEKAIKNLKKENSLRCGKLKRMRASRLAGLIRPAGYYNVQAKRLKNFISFLYSDYGGSIGRLAAEDDVRLRAALLGVNGIGPETCDSIMLYALGKPVFVVDAYTKRVFSRHGLVKKDDTYHDVQRRFTGNLPRDPKLYNEYHALIVRLAKEHCRVKPLCSSCPIGRFK
jgi:endonuclease-3 related protein